MLVARWLGKEMEGFLLDARQRREGAGRCAVVGEEGYVGTVAVKSEHWYVYDAASRRRSKEDSDRPPAMREALAALFAFRSETFQQRPSFPSRWEIPSHNHVQWLS